MKRTESEMQAIQDFRRARSRASLERVVASLTGKPADLLAYDEVRQMLRAREQATSRLQDIPLDAIVGSVGRYSDFTRSFLPRQDSDQGRWARVRTAVTSMEGVPPIQVYQIGDAYFVRDGNHRVSVARDLGASHIEAYVTQVITRVPLTPDVELDDLIIKSEYANFLTHTNLDELRPGANLTVTAPGKYELLEEHISVHRYFMGLDQQREISYAEAVGHFYDTVYLPMVQVIRERGLLWHFPGRTEADLYLWLGEHRAELQQAWGWEIGPLAAADDLVEQHSPRAGRVAARVSERMLESLAPLDLVTGPPPGLWHSEDTVWRDRLFGTVLVATSGQETDWTALEQALVIAQREGGQLRGLHVVANPEQVAGEAASVVQADFEQRCLAAGIEGSLVVRYGRVSQQICAGARWSDLVVLRLLHPPSDGLLSRLGSGLRALIQRCSRPLLMVPPGTPSQLERALLAYDGSPKADEALYIATYMAGVWGTQLAVVTVAENGNMAGDPLARAETYLAERGISGEQVQLIAAEGTPADVIQRQATEFGADLLVMGGYGMGPLVEVLLGSSVDRVLRETKRPVLICR